MSQPNNLQELLNTSLKNLRELVDVNTIIGTPITAPDGTILIPISKVSFGFASGGSDIPTSKPTELFGGGSGGGVSISPIGFIVIANGEVKLLQMSSADNTADRMVNMVPELLDKLSSAFTKKKDKKEEPKEEAVVPNPELEA